MIDALERLKSQAVETVTLTVTLRTPANGSPGLAVHAALTVDERKLARPDAKQRSIGRRGAGRPAVGLIDFTRPGHYCDSRDTGDATDKPQET